MPRWSWDGQLCCAEISLPAGKLRGGSEFWSLHRWVAAVHPAPGASPAFVAISAPCLDGHLCLLAPCPTSPWGKQFVSSTSCSCPRPRGILTHWSFCAADIKIHTSCLCLCCIETTEELFNKYPNKYYIPAKASVVFIFLYICTPLQEFWCKNNR